MQSYTRITRTHSVKLMVFRHVLCFLATWQEQGIGTLLVDEDELWSKHYFLDTSCWDEAGLNSFIPSCSPGQVPLVKTDQAALTQKIIIIVSSTQIKSPQTCKPNNFWMSSWHKDSSFSLELLASSIWGFTTSVGWVEAALYRLYHRWHHEVMRSWLPNIRGASSILRRGLQGYTVAVMRHSVLTVESQ